MKIKVFALLLISLFLVSCSKGKKAEGQDCETNDDCVSGICLNLAQVDDDCAGMVCAATCVNNASCTLEQHADCDPVEGGQRVCLYESWEARFCGGN